MKLSKLPKLGQTYSRAVYCSDDGTPITTYHDVKVDNVFTAKRSSKYENYATLTSNRFHGYITVRVYIMDLSAWKFFK